jgi:hypothetical protein
MFTISSPILNAVFEMYPKVNCAKNYPRFTRSKEALGNKTEHFIWIGRLSIILSF